MTRAHFAIILLLTLLTLCILVSCSITKRADAAAAMLHSAEQSAVDGDYAGAIRQCQQAAAYWKQQHLLLAAFLHHDEPDAVESGIAELIAYAKREDDDEFLALCEQVITQLTHLKEMNTPTLQNIL